MEVETSVKHVHALITKAAQTHGGSEAMQYAQAAYNAANALAALNVVMPPEERMKYTMG